MLPASPGTVLQGNCSNAWCPAQHLGKHKKAAAHVPVQAFLTKLLTVDLPGLIVLPKRLDINIPPAVTAVAEAAVGRDAVMRAVASAVLQVLLLKPLRPNRNPMKSPIM